MTPVLRRPEGERFSEILPVWKDGAVAIICGGPSLTLDQVEQVRRAREDGRLVGVIAVNDAYLWAPFADVNYFADSHWWKWHHEGIAKPTLGLTASDVRRMFAEFAGQKCSIQNSGGNIKDDAVHIVRNLTYPNRSNELSTDPRKLGIGSNGGFQSMNLAVLAQAKTIAFLALDGYSGHWHGSHPRPEAQGVFEEMRKAFSAVETKLIQLGVQVFNCAPGSRIDSFPKCSFDQVFA